MNWRRKKLKHTWLAFKALPGGGDTLSVVKMKLLNIIGPNSEFDRCAMQYVLKSGMHLENVFSFLDNVKGLYPYSDTNPYSQLLKKVESAFSHARLKIEFDKDAITDEPPELLEKYVEAADACMFELLDKLEAVERDINGTQELIRQLTIMRETNVAVQELFHLEFVRFRFGKLPRESYKKLEIAGNEIEMFFVPLSFDGDFVWGMYFTPTHYHDKVDSIMASLYFERVRISDEATGTPQEALERLSKELEALQEQQKKLTEEIERFTETEQKNLVHIFSTVKFRYEAFNLRRYAGHTRESFYIAGWLPEDEVPAMAARLDLDPSLSYIVEEPEEVAKIMPPTKTKNFRFARPFEEFVNMYGLPVYHEIDPTLLLTITYIIMFGIMFGDLGQGIVLSIAGFLLYHFKRFKLGAIAGYCGISSAIFGLLFGSFFGFEDKIPALLFEPMESSTTMNQILISAVGIGAVLILFVIVLNIANGIRQKNLEKIFFGQNGLAGFILYGSAMVAAVLYFLKGKSILSGAFVVILIVLPIVSIFLKEPLSRFFSHKRALADGGIGDFILEAFFELFEILLSFVTNTISFVRVGAFALVHAGMMSVVILFFNQMQGVSGYVILVLGNFLVMAMEALIVGIQVLRLEFYELFGRFYNGAGKEYVPICTILK